jgi:hypothetical protein
MSRRLPPAHRRRRCRRAGRRQPSRRPPRRAPRLLPRGRMTSSPTPSFLSRRRRGQTYLLLRAAPDPPRAWRSTALRSTSRLSPRPSVPSHSGSRPKHPHRRSSGRRRRLDAPSPRRLHASSPRRRRAPRVRTSTVRPPARRRPARRRPARRRPGRRPPARRSRTRRAPRRRPQSHVPVLTSRRCDTPCRRRHASRQRRVTPPSAADRRRPALHRRSRPARCAGSPATPPGWLRCSRSSECSACSGRPVSRWPATAGGRSRDPLV